MKHCHFILFSLTVILLNIGVVSRAVAASVLFGSGVSLTGSASPSENRGRWYLSLSFLDHGSGVWIAIDKNGSSGRILHQDGITLGSGVKFVFADNGELISEASVAESDRVLSSNYDDDFSIYSFSQLTPWTLYLGVEAWTYGPDSGNIQPDIQRNFGWVELTVRNYTLTLERSCLDLTGRPVVVGVRSVEPVPEPATHVLALLGTLLLFPRRRRMDNSKQGNSR